MPHLRSLSGLLMLLRYVSNWVPVLCVYGGILPRATAEFRDGEKVDVSSKEFSLFLEKLYRRYNTDHGFVYCVDTQGRTSVLLQNGLRINLPPDVPWSFVLDEIFLMEVYKKSGTMNHAVVDVGASIGDSTLYFASLGAEVFAFEPHAEFYGLAVQNVKQSGYERRVHLFNQAVAGGSGPGTLSQLLSEYSIDHVLLKMDCEGCESNVIMQTEDVAFERIQDIILEFHSDPAAIIGRLRQLGYKVRKKREIVYATHE